MAISEARRRAIEKWDQKQDDVRFRVPKGQREAIKQHATSCNESLNAFIVRAIRETMARDAERMDPE